MEGDEARSETPKQIVEPRSSVLVCLDEQGRFTAWDPAARRALGWTEADVVGARPPSVSEDDSEAFHTFWRTALRETPGGSLPLRCRRRDGSALVMWMRAAPLSSEPGVVLARGFVFRAEREFLVNAVKHAGARRTEVHLVWSAGRLRVEVSDDGSGFDPRILESATPLAGFGLFGIPEQTERLGGSMEVASQPGEGTRVALHLPVPVPRPAKGR